MTYISEFQTAALALTEARTERETEESPRVSLIDFPTITWLCLSKPRLPLLPLGKAFPLPISLSPLPAERLRSFVSPALINSKTSLQIPLPAVISPMRFSSFADFAAESFAGEVHCGAAIAVEFPCFALLSLSDVHGPKPSRGDTIGRRSK
jgi:hypothetical protein